MPPTDSPKVDTDPWQEQDRNIKIKMLAFWSPRSETRRRSSSPEHASRASPRLSGLASALLLSSKPWGPVSNSYKTLQCSGSLLQATRGKHIVIAVLAWADTLWKNGPHCNPISRGATIFAIGASSALSGVNTYIIMQLKLKSCNMCLLCSKTELQQETSSGSSTPPAPLPLFLSPGWIPQVKPTDRTKQKHQSCMLSWGKKL